MWQDWFIKTSFLKFPVLYNLRQTVLVFLCHNTYSGRPVFDRNGTNPTPYMSTTNCCNVDTCKMEWSLYSCSMYNKHSQFQVLSFLFACCKPGVRWRHIRYFSASLLRDRVFYCIQVQVSSMTNKTLMTYQIIGALYAGPWKNSPGYDDNNYYWCNINPLDQYGTVARYLLNT